MGTISEPLLLDGDSTLLDGRYGHPLSSVSDTDPEEWESGSGANSGGGSPRESHGGTARGVAHREDGDDEAQSRRQHLLSAFNLGNNGNRWGWRFDPDRPIYRVWTNIRGRKVHYAMATWTMLLLVATLGCRVDGGDESLRDIFTVHIVMMIFCWLLMSEGLIAYRAGELGTATVESLRLVHRGLMTFAGVLMLCGVVAIIAHKSDHGKSVVPSSVHGVCGTIAVLATAGQASMGAMKHSRFLRNQGKSFAWHGNMGQALYGLVVVTLVLGFLQMRNINFFGVWIFFITIAAGTITVMAAMYQPTSLGGDQHDQVKPTRDIGDHDVELLTIE